MQRGYVKVWRKIEDSGLLQNPTAWQVFGWLLIKATRTERRTSIRGQVFELMPGEYATSVSALCTALKLSTQQCRTALKFLEKLEILTSKSTNNGTVFSIINWETYQNTEQDAQQTGNKRLTNAQQTGNKPLKQELKNERIKEVLTSSASEAVLKGRKKTLRGKRAETFERFWEAFAYRKDRAQAIDAWAAIPTLTDALVETICQAAAREARRRPELISSGRTPIYAQGWINGRRWEDEEQTAEEERGFKFV